MLNKIFFFFSSTLIERFTGLILIAFISKQFSIEYYGVWSQIIVIAGILTPVTLLGFQTSLIKFLPGSQIEEKGSLKLGSLILILGAFLFIFVIFLLFSKPLSALFFGDDSYTEYVGALLFVLSSEALFEYLIALIRAEDKIKSSAFFYLCKSLAKASSIMIASTYLFSDFLMVLYVFGFVQLFLIFFMGFASGNFKFILASKLNYFKKEKIKILTYTFPIVLLGILIGLNNSIERFLLTSYVDIEETGRYSVAYSLAGISTIFYSVIGFSLFPALSNSFAENNNSNASKLFSLSVESYITAVIPFIFILHTIGRDLLVLFTKTEYLVSPGLIVILAFSVAFFGFYQLSFYVVLLKDNSVKTAKNFLFSILLNGLLCILLIEELGAIGAAVGSLSGNILICLFTYQEMRKYISFSIRLKNYLAIVIKVVLLVVFTLLVKTIINTNNLQGMIAFLTCSACFYIFVDLLSRKSSILLRLAKI